MTTPDTAPTDSADPGSPAEGPGERAHREPVEARLIATGTVLDSIVQARRERIEELRTRFGHLRTEELPRSQRSFTAALRTRSGQSRSPQPALIMECKAASPSRGTIRSDYDPATLAAQYAPYAAAVSVLTEPDRFNGSFDDLAAVREVVDVPVLCKDFIVDEVQVLAARSLGADAVLLMLSVVPDDVYRELAELAHSLGMEVLTEVSTPEEMHRAAALGAEVIGINNRDLRTLATDLARTEELAPLAPAGVVLIGESGVSTSDDVRRLSGLVDALLVGSSLSGAPDPGEAARDLATAVPLPQPDGEGASSSGREPGEGEREGHHPRLPAFFGPYGGQFVPELLIPALDQLEDAFIALTGDDAASPSPSARPQPTRPA